MQSSSRPIAACAVRQCGLRALPTCDAESMRRRRPILQARHSLAVIARPPLVHGALAYPQGVRRLLHLSRPAELHRGPLGVHHRPVADTHRPHQGRPAWRARGHEECRPNDRHDARGAWLHDRSVRQEPPRRSRRHAADGARLRRVLRQSLSPQRRGGAGEPGLSEGPGVQKEVRPARRHPQLRRRHASRTPAR